MVAGLSPAHASKTSVVPKITEFFWNFIKPITKLYRAFLVVLNVATYTGRYLWSTLPFL